jgi:hypothetical protein
VRLFAGPPMATSTDARLQRAREAVYDARWERHRDQALVALTAVVILVLLAAALVTVNPLFAAPVLTAPLAVPATLRRISRGPRPSLSSDVSRTELMAAPHTQKGHS